MFMRNFILKTLKNGVKNKTFTREYASMLAIGYLTKGYISEEDVFELDMFFTSLEQPIITETEEPVVEDIPTEDFTTDMESEPIEDVWNDDTVVQMMH